MQPNISNNYALLMINLSCRTTEKPTKNASGSIPATKRSKTRKRTNLVPRCDRRLGMPGGIGQKSHRTLIIARACVSAVPQKKRTSARSSREPRPSWRNGIALVSYSLASAGRSESKIPGSSPGGGGFFFSILSPPPQ